MASEPTDDIIMDQRNMMAASQLDMDMVIQRALPLSHQMKKRRREYNTYTPETRTRIAKYAMQAGDLEAAQYFSRELRHKVGVSSVWRFRKAYMRELKRIHQDTNQSVPPVSAERKLSRGKPCTRNKSPLVNVQLKQGGDQQMDVVGDNDWTPPTEAEMKIIQARKERSDKISKLMGDYLLKGYRMLATTCPVCGTILLRDRQQTDYCVACNELDTEHAKDDPALSAEAARSQVREQELIRSASTSSHDQPQLHHVLTSSSGAETPTPPLMPSISGIYSTGTMQSSGIPIGAAAHRVQLTHVSVPPQNQQATVLPQASGPPLTTMLQQAQVVPAPIYSNAPAMNPSNQGPTDEAAPDGNGHTRIGSVVQHSLDSVLDKLTWASEELKLSNSVETSTQLCRLIQACADAADSLKHLTVN